MMSEIAMEFEEEIFSKATEESIIIPDKYWVAMSNGKVIGTVGILIIKNNTGILKNMMLKKTFRGKKNGISKLLLQTVTNWCEENKILKIYLGTMSQFKAAQIFYEENGFERILKSELPKDFLNNPLDKVFFQLNTNKKNELRSI
jgi:N-acetylglutamate synthase-like GNAT family acetyltransferase